MTATDRQTWLRNSLLGNVAFSTLSGLVFTLAAANVASFIAALVRSIGVGLLGFAGYVAFVATRPEIDLRSAGAIIAGDLAWVVATIPVVMMGLLSFEGVVAALLVADVVLMFAALQYWGVRRIRLARAAAPA